MERVPRRQLIVIVMMSDNIDIYLVLINNELRYPLETVRFRLLEIKAIKPTQQSNKVSKIILKYLFTSFKFKPYITPLNERKKS